MRSHDMASAPVRLIGSVAGICCLVSLASSTALAGGPLAKVSNAQPGCGVDHQGPAQGLSSGVDSSSQTPAADMQMTCDALSNVEIGLVVFYEDALLDTHGGKYVETWISDRVKESNHLFAKSGASAVTYKLVGMRPVSTLVPDIGPNQGRSRVQEILERWQREGDDHYLTQLRDGYGADVAMLVTVPFVDEYAGTSDICGIASLPVLVGGNEVLSADGLPYDQRAFALAEFECGQDFSKALGGQRNDYTFAHELGHTLGLNHASIQNIEPVLSYAKGYVIHPTFPELASVMACVRDESRPVPAGVCNRVEHFSNPDVTYPHPSCKACQPLPTGTADRNNAEAICMRAPTYSGFRTPDGDYPPFVIGSSPWDGLTIASGTLISVSATAGDVEDGDLSSTVQWVDETGVVLANGPNATFNVYSIGQIAARVTDSNGQTDHWWLRLRVTTTPDAYEPDSSNGPVLGLNDVHERNFHTAEDLDLATIYAPAAGDTYRVQVTPVGNRVAPIVELKSCGFGLGCGQFQQVGLDFELEQGTFVSSYVIRVREANSRSGVGTDYEISLTDVVQPQTVFPFTGPWWNPNRSGNGVDLQRTSDGQYFATWFTYRNDGSPIWYISGVAPISGSEWSAPLYRTSWNHSTGTSQTFEVGTFAMSFNDDLSGTLHHTLQGTTRSEPFESFAFGGPTNNDAHGAWYDPNEPGWGVTINHRGDVVIITATTYDAAGQPTWTQGVATGPVSNLTVGMSHVGNGTSLCPGCTGNTPLAVEPAGTATLSLPTPSSGWASFSIDVDYVFASGGWARDTSIVRLTPLP